MAVKLPTKPSVPQLSLRDWRWHVHGFPKVGKTTFTSFFPHPLFVQSEKGTRSMKIYGVDIESWDDVRSLAEQLHSQKNEFETIIFDTIDRVYDLCLDCVAEENGVAHVSQMKWGAGWTEAARRFYNLLEDLFQSWGVVLISHSRYVEVSQGVVQATKTVPDLSASPREIISGWVDGILYLQIEEVQREKGKDVVEVVRQRSLVCQPTPYIEAGGRGPFRFMPQTVALGNSPKEGFAEFRKAYDVAVAEYLAELNESSKEVTPPKKGRK